MQSILTPKEAGGLTSHTVGVGVYSDTLNHSKSVTKPLSQANYKKNSN